MIYFVSDTHFSHYAIIRYCNRPFTNADEMNECMIRKWNDTVTPEDTVFHLGDFSFHESEHLFHRLHGQKHLIIGNHDSRKTLTLPWSSQPQHYRDIKVRDEEGIERRLVLFHYPVTEWDGYYRGAIHLHGHVHGKLLPDCEKIRVDVGVDSWDFKPVTVDEILKKVQ